MLGHTPVKAFGVNPMLHALSQTNTNRILVLLQLEGGNDGLNTIIPIRNDIYYQQRPNLGIRSRDALALSDDFSMHASMAPLQDLYRRGQMGIVHGVGYPEPNLSHFRSTDIWASASDSNDYLRSGWTGRSLESMYPTFAASPPEHPLGVQLGGSSLLFRGNTSSMGMSLESPEQFENLAQGGTLYDTINVPTTTYGNEVAFVRQIANNTFRYAAAIQEASTRAQNKVDYPDGELAGQLAIIAKLIKGNLGAQVYVAQLGGFDTHSSQEEFHAYLLMELAGAVNAFIQDLEADNRMQDVLMMTFSEFGRTLWENGSAGTDHATAAPLFLFGPAAEGGFHGNALDLSNVDDNGDVLHTTDFRSVYASVLTDWLEMDTASVESVLGRSFDTLPIVNTSGRSGSPTSADSTTVQGTFALHGNYPNPFTRTTTVSYELRRSDHVQLRVFDLQGRLVETLADHVQTAGIHRVVFAPSRLPSGSYFYRLETSAGTQSRKMTLVR